MTTILALVFALALMPRVASAQADHLQCFKIKDNAVKATYTANLTPTDNTFAAATGCRIKVPAKLLCVDTQKTNVTPPPPGAAAGAPAQKYLCYKAKCPKAPATTTIQDQFGTHQVTVKTTSLLCAPEPAPTTTTTTTSTTTTTGCANIDNDMDGFFAPPCGIDCDDNNPNVNPVATITCGVGACQNTVPSCAGFVPNTCTPNPPSTEQCQNGIDDDCDGLVDEQPCTCASAAQCPPVANGFPQCQAGQCTFFCAMGFSDCNAFAGDGCEVNTQTDPNNCSACGNVCVLPNATEGCSNGTCTIQFCDAGYGNCNGMPADGCEVFLPNNPNHCGACNVACPPSFPTCNGNMCQ